jgi:hypothetical protein
MSFLTMFTFSDMVMVKSESSAISNHSLADSDLPGATSNNKGKVSSKRATEHHDDDSSPAIKRTKIGQSSQSSKICEAVDQLLSSNHINAKASDKSITKLEVVLEDEVEEGKEDTTPASGLGSASAEMENAVETKAMLPYWQTSKAIPTGTGRETSAVCRTDGEEKVIRSGDELSSAANASSRSLKDIV